MQTAFLIVSWLMAAGWTYKLVESALGMPRVPDLGTPEWDTKPEPAPRVSIIVPALNESATIEPALRSLFTLDYPNYEVIAVNDRSTDSTGEIMERVAAESGGRIKVVHVKELPPGWLGKPHALQKGTEQATGDYLLFTDADVHFRSDVLRRALAFAEVKHADHLVIFPTLELRTPGEKMMISIFTFIFAIHRPWKAPDPRARDFVGVGAFNLVRREALQKIGGLERLRMEVVEDMKLGKLIKRAGLTQYAVFGSDLLSLHWGAGIRGIMNNMRKNTFAYMEFSWLMTLGGLVGVLLLHVWPFFAVFLLPGWMKLPYAVILTMIALFYVGIAHRLRISWAYFVLHPVGALLNGFMVLRSAIATTRQGGVIWRGTLYPIAELKKGIV
jgi:glycosyltransferase involved in cell wall biosynthesis